MKNMKKFASVLVAIVLVLAMSVPTFAAETGSITIANPVEGQTYKVYEMFSFTPASGGTAEGGIYTVLTDWDGFMSGDGAAYFDVTDDTIAVKEEIDMAELAKKALAYAQSKNIEPDATKTTVNDKGEDGTIVFDNLALGYYLVDSSLGALCALTNTNYNAKLNEKNEAPELNKQVKEDSKGDWGKWNDDDIGKTIYYKATITVGEGAENYVMHDKMDATLEFDGATSVKVTVNGSAVDATNYTITESPSDGCTFDVEFKNDYITTLSKGTEIVVEYTATLTENAIIYAGGVDESNDNEAWLGYGDNNETIHDTTKTYTYKFNLKKTDENGNELNGAKFRLYSDKGCTNEIPVVKDGDKYRVAVDGEVGVDIEVGKIAIEGLDADTYYLKEIEAPTGYNKLTEAKVFSIDEFNEEDTYTVLDVKVENKTGSLLPETGGMGTTMFYVLGGLLVVGAAILLVTKKRMAFEA